MLDHAPTGRIRMGDLAEALASLPSRLTRQVRRLETQGLVRREASQDDRRGVVAAITDDGRAVSRQAVATYADGIRAHFLGPLSRSQAVAVGENCRRISAALKGSGRLTGGPATLVRGGVAERPNALALKARDG